MNYDYSAWYKLTTKEPTAGAFVLIGMEGSYPVVGKRCRYVKDGNEYLTNEFYIPATGNRIRQLKSRPIYWLPIEGGMKCEE